MAEKQRVLFLCTHNSARSQIAEGLLRALFPERYDTFSAGTEPGKVNPYVIRAMNEIGIDMSDHYAKNLKVFLDQSFDYVVTVCDNAAEACPYFPGGKERIHESFPDPSTFTGTEEEILAGVRTVRDQIKAWLIKTFGL